MPLRAKRRSLSVDYLLSALSPRAVAQSATVYVEAREPHDALAEIRRSIVRMKASERAQYALSLGWEIPASDVFTVGDPEVGTAELMALVDADRESAVARFAPFLERNPRAIRTLDPDSIRAILLPVIEARQADVEGTDEGDVPYTDELISALHKSMPAVSWASVRARRRSATAHVARPFAAAYRAIAGGVTWIGTLPRRMLQAFFFALSLVARPLVRLGQAIAAVPGAAFSAVHRSAVRCGDAMRGFATFIGSGVIAAISALASGLASGYASRARSGGRAARGVSTALASGYTSGTLAGVRAVRQISKWVRPLGPALRGAAVPAALSAAAGLIFYLGVLLMPSVLHRLALPTVAAPPQQPKSVAQAIGAMPGRNGHPPKGVHKLRLRPRATPSPPPLPSATPTRIASVPKHATRVRRHRVAHVAWKFDPKRNPFVSGRRTVAFAALRPLPAPPARTPATLPSDEPLLVQRARLVVASYLGSIRRGDASQALGNLGLSAGAPVSNLSEATLFSGATNFRIVGSALRQDGNSAKVDVDILSERGRYFGVYTVVADGPAVRITDHTLIPASATPRL